MAEIHIACASDLNYAPHCATMLHSVFTSHPHSVVNVHFMHTPDLDGPTLSKLRSFVSSLGGKLHGHCMPESLIATLPRMSRIPQIMWLRVWLPKLLPDCERVLYLDVDTMVMQSLDELWQAPLDECLVGAVDNILEPNQRGRPAALGLPPEAGYFNSGVLLMNLELMRRENTSEKVIEYASSNKDRLLWPDQDALNHVLGRRRFRLHPRWNCQNSYFYWRKWSAEILGEELLDEAVGSPGILHFEGPGWAKPWHYLSDHPYRKIWQRHQHASGWPTPTPDGRTCKNIAIYYLPRPVLKFVRRVLRLPERPVPTGGRKLL